MAKSARRGSWPPSIEVFGVGAILYTRDGRYLMQLRDDRPDVSMRGQWGLFGGVVERSESPARALMRELAEELAFTPSSKPRRFSQVGWNLGFAGHGTHAKVLYEVPVTDRAVRAMRLGEGSAMRLFSLPELLALRNVVPWDAFAITMFDRRAVIRRHARGYRGSRGSLRR